MGEKRPNGETEITPAMIDAGVAAYEENVQAFPPAQLVAEVYSAMDAARLGVGASRSAHRRKRRGESEGSST
jgi:hypothetical protein